MSKSTIDYIFSQEFQISFRLFEAKFIPRIYVKGKFSKENWKGERIKRRASRLALGQKRGEIEYKELLRKLKWPTLETR